MNILGDMTILLIFWGGVITKLDYIKGSFLCILGSFLKVKMDGDRGRGMFFGLLKFQIIFGVLKIPDIFWGER